MRIGFEAKRVYQNKTGLGNYGRDLLRMLTLEAPMHDYVAFTPQRANLPALFPWDNPNFQRVSGKSLGSGEVWRLWAQTLHPTFKNLDVYHGLSGELPLGLPIPAVVTIHDVLFERYPSLYSPIDRWIHFKKFQSAAQRAQQVVAISEQTKQDIHTFLDIPLEKIQVIYQGCHTLFSHRFSEEEKALTRQKWGLPAQFLLGVGTLEKRKNMEVVIKALRETDIPLVLVGGRTSYTAYLEKLIVEYKMEHRVWFPTAVNLTELVQLYQSALALVYPSVFEGFGIPIIEGLRSGIPVLTSQGGCFPEAGGQGAYYLAPTNPEEWQQQIKQVVGDPEGQKARIQAGHVHVEKFESKYLVPQWLNLYQSLISD